MKIETDKNFITAPDITRKKTATSLNAGVAKPAKTDSNAFSVQFSSTLERMNKTAPEVDEVRQQKVEDIRQQLASGTYNLSGKDVAMKILNALKG